MVGFKHGDPQTNALANGGQNISFQRVGIGGITTIFFKGYFKTFEDTFTSDFEETITYGRMDPIMNFKRTGRKISVSFDVVAGDLAEAKNNLLKIQKLAQFLYPNYDGDNDPSLIKNSPMFKVKMMNLIQERRDGGGLLCTLSGFAYAPNFENGAFIEGKKIYAKSNTIQTTITPLHFKNPGWSKVRAGADDDFSQYAFPYSQGTSKSETNWQETAPDDPRFNKFDPKQGLTGKDISIMQRQMILRGENAEYKAPDPLVRNDIDYGAGVVKKNK